MTAGQRGGRGCRLMEKGESPKGQRLEITLCQKEKKNVVKERKMPISG